MALKPVTGTSFKKPRSFKDVGMNFRVNPNTKDVASVINDNAIKQSIRNLVLTTPGEKPFSPNIGSRISELLFEPLDQFTSDSVKEEVINTIEQYEPRVVLSTVNVRTDYGKNQLEVFIEYTIVGLPTVETIEFVLKRPE
jgi:hypothetical protein|tara:strand:- start:7007 stop:7426 length:420 start_codon:yes stop_codon:yes gene_type:complete